MFGKLPRRTKGLGDMYAHIINYRIKGIIFMKIAATHKKTGKRVQMDYINIQSAKARNPNFKDFEWVN